ncbi:hypothetical protein CS542_00320 [Pedobacter sp. IW39]|nr:hypothetical protein CS542_00320 [Pedobacter sp. IW39]
MQPSHSIYCTKSISWESIKEGEICNGDQACDYADHYDNGNDIYHGSGGQAFEFRNRQRIKQALEAGI